MKPLSLLTFLASAALIGGCDPQPPAPKAAAPDAAPGSMVPPASGGPGSTNQPPADPARQ